VKIGPPLLEETGLVGVVERHVGDVVRDAPDAKVYLIRDFLVSVADRSRLRSGDDATDARWFSSRELLGLDTSPGLVSALADWGFLSR